MIIGDLEDRLGVILEFVEFMNNHGLFNLQETVVG